MTLSFKIVFDLIEKQKIILGGSSGINMAGAIKLAKKMGPGKTIVTILCDHGKRYASKIFNKKFLEEKKLPYTKMVIVFDLKEFRTIRLRIIKEIFSFLLFQQFFPHP